MKIPNIEVTTDPTYTMGQIEAVAFALPWRNMLTEKGPEIWDNEGLPVGFICNGITAALICNAVNGTDKYDGARLTPAELSADLSAANEQLEKLWAVIQNPSVVNYLEALKEDPSKGSDA